jgi:hypothetical protein
MMKIVSFLFLTLHFFAAAAQDLLPKERERNDFFVIVQGGYNLGVGKIEITEDLSVRNKGNMYRLKAVAGYFVTPLLSVGLGAGLDGFHKPSFNTFPVMADVRYFFKSSGNHPFAGVALGHSVKLSDEFKSGLYSGINFGYNFGKGRKTPVLVSAGIDFHQIKDASTYIYYEQTQTFMYVQSTFWITSVSFNVALLF